MTEPIQHAPGEHVLVRDHRLWVEREGSGPTIVLLSGLGPAGSHVIFHPWGAQLAETFEVVYVDLHGRGRSDQPGDLHEITFADDVADIAAVLELLDAPVHIYGFSYGGLLAQALALDFPQLVDRLILANTLHSPEMWQANHANINPEIANQDPARWERIQTLRANGLPSTHPDVQREFAGAQPLVRFFNAGNAARLPSEPGSRNMELYPVFCGEDVDFIIGGEIPRIPDFRPRLAELAQPPLILAGRYDRALYPALQRDFEHFAPGSELILLERSGSFAHLEEPERVTEHVRCFLERDPPSRVRQG